MSDGATIMPPTSGPVLEGPIVEREFYVGDGVNDHRSVVISLWTRLGSRKHFDVKRHPKIGYRAMEVAQLARARAPTEFAFPNPCLVPLDEGETEDGPHVYALVTFKETK